MNYQKKQRKEKHNMSYKETSKQALYAKYHIYPDDYPTHTPYTEDEKRDLNELFEIPVLEQNKTTKNKELLKYDFH